MISNDRPLAIQVFCFLILGLTSLYSNPAQSSTCLDLFSKDNTRSVTPLDVSHPARWKYASEPSLRQVDQIILQVQALDEASRGEVLGTHHALRYWAHSAKRYRQALKKEQRPAGAERNHFLAKKAAWRATYLDIVTSVVKEMILYSEGRLSAEARASLANIFRQHFFSIVYEITRKPAEKLRQDPARIVDKIGEVLEENPSIVTIEDFGWIIDQALAGKIRIQGSRFLEHYETFPGTQTILERKLVEAAQDTTELSYRPESALSLATYANLSREGAISLLRAFSHQPTAELFAKPNSIDFSEPYAMFSINALRNGPFDFRKNPPLSPQEAEALQDIFETGQNLAIRLSALQTLCEGTTLRPDNPHIRTDHDIESHIHTSVRTMKYLVTALNFVGGTEVRERVVRLIDQYFFTKLDNLPDQIDPNSPLPTRVGLILPLILTIENKKREVKHTEGILREHRTEVLDWLHRNHDNESQIPVAITDNILAALGNENKTTGKRTIPEPETVQTYLDILENLNVRREVADQASSLLSTHAVSISTTADMKRLRSICILSRNIQSPLYQFRHRLLETLGEAEKQMRGLNSASQIAFWLKELQDLTLEPNEMIQAFNQPAIAAATSRLSTVPLAKSIRDVIKTRIKTQSGENSYTRKLQEILDTAPSESE